MKNSKRLTENERWACRELGGEATARKQYEQQIQTNTQLQMKQCSSESFGSFLLSKMEDMFGKVPR